MRKQLDKNNLIMMLSNIFLVLPVIYATIYLQWFYLFFVTGLFIFSPLYHWYKIYKSTSIFFILFKKCDWLFALGAFLYMYYYISLYIKGVFEIVFYILLSFVILFFWYGWKYADYKKMHPYFHIIAPMISSAILVLAHIQNIK